MRDRVIVGVLCIFEIAAGAYVTLATWLISVLSVDDAVAADMQPNDWWAGAVERFLLGSVIAAVFGLLIWGVSTFVVRRFTPSYVRLPKVSAIAAFVIVLLAAASGSVQFGLTKPFM